MWKAIEIRVSKGLHHKLKCRSFDTRTLLIKKRYLEQEDLWKKYVI